MPLDFAAGLPDLKCLKALSSDQLIEIILQQQQLIQQLMSQQPEKEIATLLAPPSLEPAPAHLSLERDAPYLIVQPERGTGYTVILKHGTCWTIGRDVDNAIILGDQWMSRNHAILQIMESGEFYIIDLGSRNGTFVNSRRVSIPIAIHHGDLITFGQTNLYFYEHSRHLEATRSLDLAALRPDGPITGSLHIRRLISVLVIDIRDFTGLTRRLEEQVLSDLVGTWFRCSGEIIRRHGSWVDKYIGDAVMAVWIHGAANIQDIQSPLRALIELQQMTSRLHLAYGLPLPLQIGAGINTGYAMVGNTGSGDRPDYTALGDTVNAAFGLENSTKQLGVDLALGPTTYQALQEWFGDHLPFQSSVAQFKGYDAPMQVYVCTFTALAQFLQDLALHTLKDDAPNL